MGHRKPVFDRHLSFAIASRLAKPHIDFEVRRMVVADFVLVAIGCARTCLMWLQLERVDIVAAKVQLE